MKGVLISTILDSIFTLHCPLSPFGIHPYHFAITKPLLKVTVDFFRQVVLDEVPKQSKHQAALIHQPGDSGIILLSQQVPSPPQLWVVVCTRSVANLA